MTGAVLDGYAVCDGYAGLFYYMANAVGIKALYEDGTSISEQRGHAWNLLEMDNAYYYVDPTNAYFKENGEPGSEVLYGQKYFLHFINLIVRQLRIPTKTSLRMIG